MHRFNRLAAVAAAAASFAAIAAAPASAQVQIDMAYNPCVDDPNVPNCVNYAIDVADRTVQYAEDTYNREVPPRVEMAACLVVETLTERDCE